MLLRSAALTALAVAPALAIDCSFAATYPRQYVAYRVADGTDLVIDGKLDDPLWTEVAFTENFVDINTTTTPWLTTHAKMRWNDEYLFVGAVVQDPAVWANISSTCHCIDPTHDQVIFHDNDFEIFTDPAGSCHNYKEFEMNAFNATWDLLLNKPYDDGGGENSSRVYGPAGWDMQPPLHCATSVIGGRINDPSSRPLGWSLEVALPIAKLMDSQPTAVAPAPGGVWRINFSRVEWAVKVINNTYQKYPSCQSCPVPGTNVEDNWVWSPQGTIEMHRPENWGILQFADGPVNGTAPVRYDQWTIRSVAMEVYRAQHAYAAANGGAFTGNLTALAAFADPNTLDGTCTGVPSFDAVNATAFTSRIVSKDGTQTATITDDRLLLVAVKP